jgi:hypothetical protein
MERTVPANFHDRRTERKRAKARAAAEGTWQGCMFWIEKKRRYCSGPRVGGGTLCGTHAARDGRVPCPLDANHNVAAADVQKHLLVCPRAKFAARVRAIGGFEQDANAGHVSEAPVLRTRAVLKDLLDGF